MAGSIRHSDRRIRLALTKFLTNKCLTIILKLEEPHHEKTLNKFGRNFLRDTTTILIKTLLINDFTYKDFTYKDFTYKDFTYKDFT